MKGRFLTVLSCLCTVLLFYAGCDAPPQVEEPRPEPVAMEAAKPAKFSPAAVDILPLTALAGPNQVGAERVLKAYVAVLDAFGSQIKAPVSLRFELYEHVQRSAEPRGKRITIWPDVDLTDAVVNNSYWQDFLRAYKFELPLGQTEAKDFILEVTCVYPEDHRLSDELVLKP